MQPCDPVHNEKINILQAYPFYYAHHALPHTSNHLIFSGSETCIYKSIFPVCSSISRPHSPYGGHPLSDLPLLLLGIAPLSFQPYIRSLSLPPLLSALLCSSSELPGFPLHPSPVRSVERQPLGVGSRPPRAPFCRQDLIPLLLNPVLLPNPALLVHSSLHLHIRKTGHGVPLVVSVLVVSRRVVSSPLLLCLSIRALFVQMNLALAARARLMFYCLRVFFK